MQVQVELATFAASTDGIILFAFGNHILSLPLQALSRVVLRHELVEQLVPPGVGIT